MKRYKYMFFLLFSMVCINLNAQSENAITFPVSGNFNFDPEVGQIKDFNKVVIESNVFHLKMNDVVIRSYQSVAEIKGGFAVEQFYLDNQSANQPIEIFNIHITDIAENECFFTISYPQGSEKIHLIREN